MPLWQAPSTHYENQDGSGGAPSIPVPYLDVDGVVRWATDAASVPAGATRLYVVIRAADSVRVFSTDNASERAPTLYGANIIHFR